MPTIERSIHVATSPDLAWSYLADVSHLPAYFDSLTSARPDGGERVHVTAVTPGGPQEGEAWLRADEGARRLEWGSQQRADYRGWLTVAADGDGCLVSLGIDMQREDVDDSIGRTLDNVQRVLEAAG